MSLDDPKIPGPNSSPDQAAENVQDRGRRNVIKLAGLTGITGIAFNESSLQALSQTPPANAPLVAAPVQASLISKNETILPDGKETSLTYETLGSSGVRAISKTFVKRVDAGDSYKIFTTVGVSWYPKGFPPTEPTQWSRFIPLSSTALREIVTVNTEKTLFGSRL